MFLVESKHVLVQLYSFNQTFSKKEISNFEFEIFRNLCLYSYYLYFQNDILDVKKKDKKIQQLCILTNSKFYFVIFA